MRAVLTEFEGAEPGLAKALRSGLGVAARFAFEHVFFAEARQSFGFRSGIWVTNDEGRVLALTVWDTDAAAQMFADSQVRAAIKRCELCDVLGIA
jgi:hypothetical protein